MNQAQLDAFAAIAEDLFKGETGEVYVEAGSTAAVVTLQGGDAVEATPA